MTRKDLTVIALAWLVPLTFALMGVGFFGGGVPLHTHADANNGGQLGNNVVTQAIIAAGAVHNGALTTATGSNTSACSGSTFNFTMNDYSFFPNLGAGGCNSSQSILAWNTANVNDYVARAGTSGAASAGSVAYQWRYIAASDAPYWWVAYDATGNILGVQVSDDPPTPGFSGSPFSFTDKVTGLPLAGVTYKQILPADLQAMNIPAAAYAAADALIAAKGWKPANRDYRALQQYANHPAPSAWFYNNVKLPGGVLTPTVALQ